MLADYEVIEIFCNIDDFIKQNKDEIENFKMLECSIN